MTYDFVVIGAGAAGITSALILARNGHRVALVEKQEQTAPLLRGFSRRRIHFDTGFHYTGGLGEGEPLDLFFRYLGLTDHLTTFAFREDGFDQFRSMREGFDFKLPCGYALLGNRLKESFPQDAAAIDQYLGLVRAACDSAPYLNLAAEFSPGPLQEIQGTTLAETLDRLTGNRLLKSLLGMHSLLYGVSPAQIPFIQHARIVGNYYRSTHGIRGGGLSLARALDAALSRMGIDLYLGREATTLTVDPGGSISGVRLAGDTELSSRGCIATGDPRRLLSLVPGEVFRPAHARRIVALEESLSAFIVFAGGDTPFPTLAGTNLFILPDADSLTCLGDPPLERNPLYISAAYPDAGSTPFGFVGISPARFAETARWAASTPGNRPADYRLYKEETMERMLRLIATSCTELAGARCLEGSTPLSIRDFTGTPGGGLYGVKHMVGQYNPLPVTRIGGLYLAGQGVVAPGILGAVLSGFIACGSILGHDRLRHEVLSCR